MVAADDDRFGTGRAMIAAQWVAAVLAIVAGITVTVRLNAVADVHEPWTSWRSAIRDDGFNLFVTSAAWMLCGAILQTPLAIARGVSVLSGWIAVAVLSVYHLAVLALAAALAGFAPVMDPALGRGDPGSIFGAILIVLLFGFSLVVVSGAVFRPVEPGVPTWRLLWRGNFRTGVAITAFISWLMGIVFLFLLLIWWLGESRIPLVPESGTTVMAVAIVLAGLTGLLPVGWAVWQKREGSTGRALLRDGLLWLLTAVPAMILLLGLLLSQIGRAVPPGPAIFLAVLAIAALWKTGGWVNQRGLRRFHRPPSATNPAASPDNTVEPPKSSTEPKPPVPGPRRRPPRRAPGTRR
ncbi:hypothetical protein [Actinoplanes couchii]|uniref:Integral membrane protein n=1 Tax=Actinoplanes couchii TaxID=403638 RepID=A0ABQ3XTJ6_9ACTN|nr:hypothetical protein [Actinoplanes couchii]MDR6318968.1 MFS family permease [Actinoplanes couchii]GID61816.1 hypothetical protein Aco03nite_102200 [Actinoplanes couchii]